MRKKNKKIGPSPFPGGSKSRVNRAGQAIRNDCATFEDIGVIDEWRAAHSIVLNNFLANLRYRTKSKQVAVAQRHKRKHTIIGKLSRFPKMQLSRMDDVAGCRLIFASIDELYAFREQFHERRSRFNHELKNDVDKYDYIKFPKRTGYRGVHDVYGYNVSSETTSHLNGLLIEIQYRTLVQHAWATAVEVIGFITASQPKFEQGDQRYQKAMSLASEILARSAEGMCGPHRALSDLELVQRFLTAEKDLGLLRMLSGLNAADSELAQNRNAILIISPDNQLEILSFRDAPDALRALFALEKERPECDIVLVKADRPEDVRLAFKNYFSDATEFVRLVEEGCEALSGKRVLRNRAKTRRKKVEKKRSLMNRG